MADEKRSTCSIENRLGRPIVISMVHPNDTRRATLQPGVNAGLDKEFVDAWRAENPEAFLDHLTITDDPATDA